MDKCTSISGGRSSAFAAFHYPTKHNVFALVRIEDVKCKPKDKLLIREIEKRLDGNVFDTNDNRFIATAEDDVTLFAVLDLEQKMGRKIEWVTGRTFENLIEHKGGYLPNKMSRYCTQNMKLLPMFHWWAKNISNPIEMQIGFRRSEHKRVKKMQERLNENGLMDLKVTFGKYKSGAMKGKNKWQIIEWQKPVFPLFQNNIYPEHVMKWANNSGIRFAKYNNCVGCFHRNPIFLNKLWHHDWDNESKNNYQKMDWFMNQEGQQKDGKKHGNWQSDITYKKIKQLRMQTTLQFDDFGSCDTGFCGL